jgi:RES domain-containing protein
MIVYRICKTRYAKDLNGVGARKYGARWNQPGCECLYTSESRALALLEFTVNTNINEIPRALSIVTIDFGKAGIQELKESQLPGNWKAFPAPASTREFGTLLLKAAKTAIIKLPSSIIPNEFNYILNPLHATHKSFKIIDIADYAYDLRIKTS